MSGTASSADGADPFPADYMVISEVIHHSDAAPSEWNKLEWVDHEGRPLIESHAPAELCDAAGMELRPCPYHDSRFHHDRPMNVSALLQVRRHWESTKEIYLGLRALFRLGVDPAPLSISELWRMSYLAFAVPPYLMLSRRERTAGIPAWAAALFKTGLGLTPLTILLFESRLNGEPDPAADGQAVLAAAERHGSLIGPRHVCAGPPRLIVDVLDFVIDPPEGATIQTFDALLDDGHAFRRFGLELLNACTACYLFFLARQYVAGDLYRAVVGTPDFDDIAPQLQALEQVAVEPNVYPYIDVLDEFSAQDKRDLLRIIGDLIEPASAASESVRLPTLAHEFADQWIRPDDEGIVTRIASMTGRASSAWSGDPAVADRLTRLLTVSVRLEQSFLAMLEAAEASIRVSLGLEPFQGPLDHTTIDRLYPAHPRRLLCEMLGLDAEIGPAAASIGRGAHRVEI